MQIRSGDVVWTGILAAIGISLINDTGREIFKKITILHPYILGFIKFMVLASMGEMLALRLKNGKWFRVSGFLAKALIWGVIGLAITFMFKFYNISVIVLQTQKFLPGLDFPFTRAFFTSVFMNLTFGFVFMTAHRISDVTIEYKIEHSHFAPFAEMMEVVDWPHFIIFICKTISFFWIPAHTVVFMLPEEFRILAAAFLSIILGLFLSLGKSEKTI